MATWGEILKELTELQAHLQQSGGVLPSGEPMSAGTSFFDHVRRKYLSNLSAVTGRPVILYATKWTQGGADPDLISINSEDIQGFMEVIYGLTGPNLDLILHSPGGSAEAAEALVSYLRSKFSDIRVIVPHAAMSAACMLACSGNRIVMGRHSFLGPIDPQFIVDTSLGRQMVPAHAILEQFKLAQEEAANPQRLGSWLPILQQYGPALITQCLLAQQLSEELVAEWLERYMFNGYSDAKTRAKSIAVALADHSKFKSHGRFIARDWAEANGLITEHLETNQNFQDAVLSVFHAANHTLSATSAVKLIENHNGRAFIKQQQFFAVPTPSGGQMTPPQPPH